MSDQCGARTRQGGQCAKTAGWGTDHQGYGHCKLHGGASPGGIKYAATIEARHAATVMGAPIDIEPHAALLWCIGVAAGELAYATMMVEQLEADQAVGRVITITSTPGLQIGVDEQDAVDAIGSVMVQEAKYGAPALHVWIQVRQDATDRLARLSKMALDAGVAERQVRLAEQQTTLIAQAIRGILTDLGVANRPEVPGVVRKHLTLVAGA